ncbi:glycoside hydrolase family 2 TIM barrel-domain containing protein [Rosistilla oblonga]|uniref:glycoside hydrolase family 2 TIM barrel-domain containing protein n=1 Tax=Rosistilla oblonga TaxID=2527990 RepID=UPI003A976023
MFAERSKLQALVLATLLAFIAIGETAAQIPVTLHHDQDNGFRLLRGGKDYVVRGVGGTQHLDRLSAAGGNSIRTWSTENLDQLLDTAHKNNLSVCVGLWLGHPRHGFNYQSEAEVAAQLQTCVDAITKYKDHPAVMMWGIGNEMEGDGNNPAIWYAVDHIARVCKQIDPAHPTMTVIAELGQNKVGQIERYCPNIDIIGVNSYGGIASLDQRYRAAGGSKPYVVSEHGPHGPWEVEKTPWGSAIEASSTAKAAQYAVGFREAARQKSRLCLGSYAFLWGDKQETTATWFGMLLPDGSRLAAVDAMTEAWTGKPPENRCPQIDRLSLEKTDGLKPGDKIRATLVASDPESDPLINKWILRHDSGTVGVGGDWQAEEIALSDAVVGDSRQAVLTVPDAGGGYRLFAYVRDNKGGAAVANIPLRVDAPMIAIASPKPKFPLIVYGDAMETEPYAASGFMGNTSAVKMTLDSRDNPHSGPTCLQVEYTAVDDWGGVLWQSPPGDWTGSQPGGFDLSAAGELQFWVRGAVGGEVVNFVLGAIDGDQPYRDTAKVERKDVRLTDQWQLIRISLDGRDLTRIKTGFGWSLAGQGKPVTFYLDDIRYVAR